ncbi:MAG: hypothetical protein ACYDCO_07650 [Armatimonadota bacterium]
MLNRQERYWLDCWRRSQTTPPEAMSRRQRRNCWGAMTHGLYAARILNAEERALVADCAPLLAQMRAEFPGQEDRIDMLQLYWLFLFRAVKADHAGAIQRAGRAIRTHMRKLHRPCRPRASRPTNAWGPEEQQAWQLQLLAEIKKRKNSARNDEDALAPHA